MRFSTTGPSRLYPNEHGLLRRAVNDLDDPTEITTGGAAGWDVEFLRLCLDVWPQVLHRVVVPQAPYAKPTVDALATRAWDAGIRLEIISNPAPAGGFAAAYRARNTDLVRYCADGELVAGVRGLRFYRSGEHMTVNIAKKRGVTVRWVDLSDARAIR